MPMIQHALTNRRRGLMVLSLLFLCFHSWAQHPLIFSTHWLPQAQFAGYYMAEAKGFYKDAGLEVKIIHPPTTVNAVEYLKDGRADIISLFLVTAANQRRQGADLVGIAQMSEHSAQVFVSLKDGPVQELKDIDGRKIGIWKSGFDEVPRALVRHYGLDVEWVPILSSINLFLMGGIDLMTVMWYNEYHQIYLSGINEDEMNAFFFSEYGYDIPEDGLYVKMETYQDRRRELAAFISASVRGWEYAASNREETIGEVIRRMREARIPADESHQRWMLEKVLSLQGFADAAPKETRLREEDFRAVLEVLKAQDDSNTKVTLTYPGFFMSPLTPKD